jgi:hypothetical protein
MSQVRMSSIQGQEECGCRKLHTFNMLDFSWAKASISPLVLRSAHSSRANWALEVTDGSARARTSFPQTWALSSILLGSHLDLQSRNVSLNSGMCGLGSVTGDVWMYGAIEAQVQFPNR